MPIHEEQASAVPIVQQVEHAVYVVGHNYAFGLDGDLPRLDVVRAIPVGDVHVFGQKHVKIKQRVQFHRPFGMGVLSLGIQAQT